MCTDRNSQSGILYSGVFIKLNKYRKATVGIQGKRKTHVHNNHNNMQSVCASRDVCTYQTSSGGIYFAFGEEFDLRQTSRLDIDAIFVF